MNLRWNETKIKKKNEPAAQATPSKLIEGDRAIPGDPGGRSM